MRLTVTSRGLGSTLIAPTTGRISSPFGPRTSPTAGASSNHQGIDYAVPVGTPVEAATSGTVIYSGVQSGFGNVVQIDNGAGVVTTYGHLSQLGVGVGDRVGVGDQIALSGATGTVSGPNLHFQVAVDGVNVDPMALLGDGESGSGGVIADAGTGLDTSTGGGWGDGDQSSAQSTPLDPLTIGLVATAGALLLYTLRS